MNPYTVIFLGPSGCGKGTQAKLLIEEIKRQGDGVKVLYAESGQLLRNFMEEASYSAKIVKSKIDNGELVAEFLPIWLWGEYLVRHISGGEHLINDGMPRKLNEAYVFDSAMKFYGRPRPVVVHLSLSRDVAKQRLLLRKRTDDTEEDILKRLDWYQTNVLPSVDFFRHDDYYRFENINGEGSVEEVWEEVKARVFEKSLIG